MNDAFAPKNVRGFAEIIVHVGLLADPIEISPDPGGKIDLGRVYRRPNALVPLVRCRISPGRNSPFTSGAMLMPRASEICSAIFRMLRLAAPNINRQAIELVAYGREEVRSRNVFHKGKIARLFAVFIKDRRKIVESRVQKIAITPV